MPSSPDNSRPVSEEQLLDWVDGVLRDDEASSLARASGRADLGQRVAQMQRQRAVLRSLPDATAPAELHDRVMAALERDALLTMEQEGGGAGPTAPRLHFDGEPAGARVRRHFAAWKPRLALAAGFVLLVGGLSYFGSIVYKSMTLPTVQPGSLAQAGKESPGGIQNGMQHGTQNGTQSGEPESASQLAINDAQSKSASGLNPNSSRAVETLGDASANSADTQADTALASARAEVDSTRAAQLAMEGRLAVRVVTRDASGLAQIERARSRVSAEHVWALTREVPATVVAALMPAPKPRTAPSPGAEAPALAMDSRSKALAVLGPLLGPGAGVATISGASVDPFARVRGTFLVDVPATAKALDAVRLAFKDRLNAIVRFEELIEPALSDQRSTSQDPMWWTQPASQWAPRVRVPLMVEER